MVKLEVTIGCLAVSVTGDFDWITIETQLARSRPQLNQPLRRTFNKMPELMEGKVIIRFHIALLKFQHRFGSRLYER